jgi:molecular chaperone DnaK
VETIKTELDELLQDINRQVRQLTAAEDEGFFTTLKKTILGDDDEFFDNRDNRDYGYTPRMLPPASGYSDPYRPNDYPPRYPNSRSYEEDRRYDGNYYDNPQDNRDNYGDRSDRRSNDDVDRRSPSDLDRRSPDVDRRSSNDSDRRSSGSDRRSYRDVDQRSPSDSDQRSSSDIDRPLNRPRDRDERRPRADANDQPRDSRPRSNPPNPERRSSPPNNDWQDEDEWY